MAENDKLADMATRKLNAERRRQARRTRRSNRSRTVPSAGSTAPVDAAAELKPPIVDQLDATNDGLACLKYAFQTLLATIATPSDQLQRVVSAAEKAAEKLNKAKAELNAALKREAEARVLVHIARHNLALAIHNSKADASDEELEASRKQILALRAERDRLNNELEDVKEFTRGANLAFSRACAAASDANRVAVGVFLRSLEERLWQKKTT